MSTNLLHAHVSSFHLTLSSATLTSLKKCLDPFNYKYRRPFNIMSPEDNLPEMKKLKLTPRVIQLSLMKFCLDFVEGQRKGYGFGSFCEFFVENLEEIQQFMKEKQGSTAKLIMFLLNEMVRMWVIKSDFNTQVQRNLSNFDIMVQSIKNILQQHVNTSFIKNPLQKIGDHRQKIVAVSPASQLCPKQQFQSNSPIVSTFYPSSSNPDAQSKSVEIKIQFQQPHKWQQIILNVYLSLIAIWCLNDKSKSSLASIIHPKSNILSSPSSEQQQSAFFHVPQFLTHLHHSLHILFYLSTGSHQLKLITELFVMCSHYLVFRENDQKPVSFLRMVMYGERKLQKKLWPDVEWSKDQETKFMDLIQQHLMLDPQYRTKLLSLISQWITTGVITTNPSFLFHWHILLKTINRRIFPQLESETFNFLLETSQGNKHHRQHVTRLLSQLFNHLDADIIIKNSDQIFCLEELVDFGDGKFLTMCFGYCFAQVRNGKLSGVRRLVNRVIGIWLQIGDDCQVGKGEFLEFFAMCVESSVESGEKLLSEQNLKRLHLVEDEERLSHSLIMSSKRILTSQKKLAQTSQVSPQSLSMSRITTSQQILPSYALATSKIRSAPSSVQLQMLSQLFEQRKKSQSYFMKFMREIIVEYFEKDNIGVYEIYARYLMNKFTQFSATISAEKPLPLISNPTTFHRLLTLYESLHAIIDQKKVLSHQIYQSLFTIECLVETSTISERYAWFVRKLKYLFYGGQSQAVKEQNNTVPTQAKHQTDGRKGSNDIMAQVRNIDLLAKIKYFTSHGFWVFVKQTFFRMKNKTSFLVYVCLSCLRYYQSTKKLQKKSQQRRSQNQHDHAAELSELYVFLETHQYASVLSPCHHSISALFILYNIVIANEYNALGIKARDDLSYFEEIDENSILIEIRRILVLGMDVWTPYEIDQFLYMFTMKEGLCVKLMVFMGLTGFQTNLQFVSRLLPIVKVVKDITCKKHLTLQRKQLILPFYNHLEFTLSSTTSSFKFTLDTLFNWSLKTQNFISFCTRSCKSKLIISKDRLNLVFRKEGSSSTKKAQEKYRFKKELGEKVAWDISIKGKQLEVMVNKKIVAKITGDDVIESLKFEMINGIIIKKVSVSNPSSQPQLTSQTIPQTLQFYSSFTSLPDLQLQTKLKNLSFINFQAACITYPYGKYFFLLKELIKYNPEIGTQNVFEFLVRNLSEVYLKMLDNHVLKSGNRIKELGMGFNTTFKENIKNGDEPEEMWKCLMKVLHESFIDEKNNYCLMRKRTQTLSKVQRKYSHDVTLLKSNLARSNSANENPNLQQSHSFSLQKSIFIKNPFLPPLTPIPRYISTQGFSIYLLQMLIKVEIWEHFSQKTKLQIVEYIKSVIQLKDFSARVENQRFDIFCELLNLLEKITQNEVCPSYRTLSQSLEKSPISPLTPQLPTNPVYEALAEAINLIILNHAQSQLLKQKFKYYFYMAQIHKSPFVKNQFYTLLDTLSKDLLTTSTTSLPIAHWLLLQFQQFEFVFMNCPLSTKVKILDYLTEVSQQEEDKLIKFMSQLTPEVIFELRMWLLIYLKKMLFRLKMKTSVLKYMKVLGEVTCVLLVCWEEVKDGEQRQEMLKILKEEIDYIIQRQQNKQPISKELLNILAQEQFVRFLISIIEEFVLHPHHKSTFSPQKFSQTVFQVIFNLDKRSLLEVLTSYRRYCNNNPTLLAYPLKLELTRRLKLYQLNCFLQYVLECILSIENSLSAEETTCFAMQLKVYLEWLMKNYESLAELDYGLLYCYPKVYRWGNCCEKKEVVERVAKVAKAGIKELRGGVYFKLMIIVAHLIELKPNEDMSWIVQQILFRSYITSQKNPTKKNQKQVHAAFRAINDFSQVQSFSKQRHQSETLITAVSKKHRSYCMQHDEPYDPLEVVSNKLVKFEEENDLTPYCLDYFLMKLVNYLEWQDQERDEVVSTIYEKYSRLVIGAFGKFPLIYNDITEKNLLSEICVNDYSELLLLTAGDELLITEKVTSPSRYQFELQPSTPTKDYLGESFFQKLQTQSPSKSTKNVQFYESERFSKTVGKKDDQFLNPAAALNPKKVSSRKKSFYAVDVKESKDFLIELVKKDHINWRKKCLQKQFNKFFRNQAKELLIIELLFTYFVENSAIKPTSQVLNKQTRMIQKYFQSFEQELQRQENVNKPNQLSSKQLIQLYNLKRLYPYLLQKPPILKVKGSSLPNMCMPMLAKIPKPNYKLRQDTKMGYMQSVLGEDLRMEMFGVGDDVVQDDNLGKEEKDEFEEIEFDQKMIYTPKKSILSDSEKSYRPNSCICVQENEFQLEQNDNKSKQINYCELVTRKGVYFCQWKITLRIKNLTRSTSQMSKQSRLEYILQLQSFKSKPLDCPRLLKYGSPVSNLLSLQKLIQIQISGVREIFYRKYNQIQNNSVEMFCDDGRAHFICLYSSEKAEKIVKELQQRRGSGVKVVKNAAGQFEKKEYTAKWVNGEIDNFTYLMLLNKYSGRSFCDTNQYPVFPWVVSDFKSKVLNLSDISTYRDLTKPIGALNPQKLRRFYEKYHMQTQQTGIYLYGSHFSTSLFIYYFLVRMEPFSTLHQEMQGGSWDAPDRLFSSMEHMWESLMSPSSATDIKEAIPEFYYFPFFLKNTNYIDLGVRQSGEIVNDVILPPWATSPEDFIFKMRSALESNYVSLNLPYWIDLIFGCDQKNIKRHNLYHPLSYSENIHIDKIPQKDLQARICQISYFGQHPMKLFNKNHKLKRLAINSIFSRESLPGMMLRGSSLGKKDGVECVMMTLQQELSILKIQKSNKTENSMICCMKLRSHMLSMDFDIEVDPKVQSIDNISKKIYSSMKECEKTSKRRQTLIFSNTDKTSQVSRSARDPCYVGLTEKSCYSIHSCLTSNLLTFYPNSNPLNILTSYSFAQNYSNHLYTETFVILYGEDGIVLVNWNFEVIFSYRKRAIDCCFVDDLMMIFASRDGRVFAYDMVEKLIIQLFDLTVCEEDFRKKDLKSQKELKFSETYKTQKIYSTKMELFNQKKLISTSCEEEYKIVAVANGRKLFIINFRQMKKNWTNVQKQ